MEIRLATPEDFEIFFPIKKEFFMDYNNGQSITPKSKDFCKKEFIEFMEGILVLAIDEKKAIGYLSGKIETTPYERYGYLSEIFVKKSLRGKGVSTMLKDKFLEILKGDQINLCRVEVSPGNPAEEVYKKWNFKIDKHRLSLEL